MKLILVEPGDESLVDFEAYNIFADKIGPRKVMNFLKSK